MRNDYFDLSATKLDQERILRSQRLALRMRLAHFLSNAMQNKIRLPKGTRISRALVRRILPPLTQPLICPTVMGFDLIVSKDDGSNYYYDGFYERGTLHVMSKCLNSGDTFLDIGASIGQMTFHAANLVGSAGKVICFEPHPDRYAGLCDGITINRKENIIAYNAGLGEYEEELKLFTNRISPTLVPDGVDDNDYKSVRILNLDSVLREEGIANVRMVKIDVEGFELNVLKGARELLSSHNAPIMCIEHENLSADPLAPLYFLKEINKYNFYNLRQKKNRISKLERVVSPEHARMGDNVFCFLDQHLDSLASIGLFA